MITRRRATRTGSIKLSVCTSCSTALFVDYFFFSCDCIPFAVQALLKPN